MGTGTPGKQIVMAVVSRCEQFYATPIPWEQRYALNSVCLPACPVRFSAPGTRSVDGNFCLKYTTHFSSRLKKGSGAVPLPQNFLNGFVKSHRSLWSWRESEHLNSLAPATLPVTETRETFGFRIGLPGHV